MISLRFISNIGKNFKMWQNNKHLLIIWHILTHYFCQFSVSIFKI